MFSEALDKFYLQNKEQACAWFCAFDVGSFNRTDLVHHPPRAAGSNLYSFTSVHERGPGLSSGPQESEQENRSDVEPIITILPRRTEQEILAYEKEQMDLWWWIIPGTKEDGSDIDPPGVHTWLKAYEDGPIAQQTGGGRTGAWHQWRYELWEQRQQLEEQAQLNQRRPTGRHRPGWYQRPKGHGKVGKGWHFANWDDRKDVSRIVAK